MTDLVVHDAVVLTVDPENRVIERGTVVADDGELVAVRPTEPADRRADADAVVDGDGTVVMPGVVDAHRHMELSHTRGMWSDSGAWELGLEALAEFHSPFDVHDEAFFRAGWRYGLLQSVRSGVTTVNTMDLDPSTGVEPLREVGLRATVAPLLSDHARPEPLDEQVARARSFAAEHGSEGRLRAALGPQGDLYCSRRCWEAVADLAEEFPSLPVHTHLYELPASETAAAGADGSLDLLDQLGLLDDRLLAAHFLHADGDDAARLAEAGGSVLHCPTALSYFGTGDGEWFPYPSLREAGATVALGLDDPYWFDSFDPFREAKTARVLLGHQYGGRPAGAVATLRMLTIEAARAIGRGDEVGSLEVGKRADLVVLDADAGLRPLHDVHSLVVNAATADAVEAVFVDGEPLVRDGEVLPLDADAVVAEADEQLTRLDGETDWDVSLGGSSPPERRWGRLSVPSLGRMAAQYARGVVRSALGR